MRKNTITFTKTELAKLAPAEPGRRDCYYDSNMPGLESRVTDTGTKSFSVYKWVNGKNQRIVLGRYNPDALQSKEFEKDPLSALANNPGLSIEQARQLAAAVMMQLALGTNPLAARRATNGITLEDLFKEYLHGYAIDHCKTWKVIEECFYRYLDHWRTRPVNSIKRSEVQMLVNKLGNENGKATANRTVELLRTVINKESSGHLFIHKEKQRFPDCVKLPNLGWCQMHRMITAPTRARSFNCSDLLTDDN